MSPTHHLAAWATEVLSVEGVEAVRVTSEVRRQRTTFLMLEGSQEGRLVRFALKAFNRDGAHNSLDGVLSQYEALRLLHEATLRDGEAACPRPLAVAPSWWAYLMEHVEGVDLSRWRCTDTHERGRVADALVDVLDAYYGCDIGHYGDWTPRNVVVDGSRVRALDPGITNPVDETTVRDPALRFQPAGGDAVRWLWRVGQRLNHVGEQLPTGGTMMAVTERMLVGMGMRFAEGDVASFLDDVLAGIGRERLRARRTVKGRLGALGAYMSGRLLVRRARRLAGL